MMAIYGALGPRESRVFLDFKAEVCIFLTVSKFLSTLLKTHLSFPSSPTGNMTVALTRNVYLYLCRMGMNLGKKNTADNAY